MCVNQNQLLTNKKLSPPDYCAIGTVMEQHSRHVLWWCLYFSCLTLLIVIIQHKPLRPTFLVSTDFLYQETE